MLRISLLRRRRSPASFHHGRRPFSGSVQILLTDLLDPGDLIESYPFPSWVGLSPDETDEQLNLSLRKLLLTSPPYGVSQAHAKAVKLGLETDSRLSTIILRAYAYQTTLWGKDRPPIFDVEIYGHPKPTRLLLKPLLLNIRHYAIQNEIIPSLTSQQEMELVFKVIGDLSLFALNASKKYSEELDRMTQLTETRSQFSKHVRQTLNRCLEYESDEENSNSTISNYLRWNSEVNKSFQDLTSTEKIKMMEALYQMEKDANYVGNSYVYRYYTRFNGKREMGDKIPADKYGYDYDMLYTHHAMVARPNDQNIITVVKWKKDIVKHINSFMEKTSNFHILTAHSQKSYMHGVSTLITGLLTGEDGKRVMFCQSFFLVPETSHGRYLAMNDILRYVSVEIDPHIGEKSYVRVVIDPHIGEKSYSRFIKAYYLCMSLSPETLHTFYVEDSLLGRQTCGGDMVSFTSLKSIKESFHSQISKIHIFTAHSQPSFHRSVLLLVTGSVTLEDGGSKPFIQSFLLAPHAETYIIQNDIQQYVEVDSLQPEPESPINVDAPKSPFKEMAQRLKRELPTFDIQTHFPVETLNRNKDRSYEDRRKLSMSSLANLPDPHTQALEFGDNLKLGKESDWYKAVSLLRTKLPADVELISSSTRGFAVSYGSLIGFLPYRNLAAKWKFLAFESWLRRKGVDPSLYRQNLGVIGGQDVTSKAPSPDSSLVDSEVGNTVNGEVSSDMKLEDLLMVYEREKQKFLSSYVGQKIKVNVVMANRHSRELIFSMRPTENEEEVEKKRNLMAKLRVGDVVKCCIKKITYFGIFCELEGVPALIHQSEVSWDATLDPASYFKIGQIVEAKVHQLDFALERIFLSLKEITPDPLTEALGSVVGDNDQLGKLQAAELDAEWPDVESLIKELEMVEGIQSVSKGGFFLSPGLAPTFRVYMAPMFEKQYKLLARAGNRVQELIVEASLSEEEMKSTIMSCTNRVE